MYVIRFAYVPSPYIKEVLAQVLLKSLNMFNLNAEKFFVVVVDNHTTNDAMIGVLRNTFDSESLILDGQFLHVRCSAHVLNLVVQDGLDMIAKSIEKIRNCVLFWSASPKRLEKFEDKAKALKLDCSRKLALDCKTRWNSTFLMLKSALPYKDVFAKLKINDPAIKFDLPSDEEWKFSTIVCNKLEVFYEVTSLFSGRKFPTANLFFKHICEIKIELGVWLCGVNEPEIIRKMAASMLEKFDKYWGIVNKLLAVAASLDPKNKLACVRFYYEHIFGEEEAEIEVEMIKSLLYRLLASYQEKYPSISVGSASNKDIVSAKRQMSVDPSSKSASIGSGSSRATRWDVASRNASRSNVMYARAELDLYLEEAPRPPSDNFDVLNFWKLDLKYPTLRMVAKDILAIPATSVASESAFSAGGRLVTPHRSKLHSNTVEALACLQSWGIDELAGLQVGNSQACGTHTDEEEEVNSSEVVNDFLFEGAVFLNLGPLG